VNVSLIRSWPPHGVFLVAAGLLLAAALLILRLPGYAASPEVVAPALAIDLVVGLPLLGWIFLVRTGKADVLVLAPLVILGLVIAEWWIPDAHLDVSRWGTTIALVAEGLVVLTLVLRGRTLRREYRARLHRHVFARDAFQAALGDVLGPRIAAAVASELGALWYAFAGWRRPRQPARGQAFAVHTRNGYPALLGALMMAVIAETVAVHLVVSRWSGTAAWILAGLSVYSGVWLLGDLLAARHNPTVVTDDDLHLRLGLRWKADVPRSRIRAITEVEPEGEDGSSPVNVAFWGDPDLWVEFTEPVVLDGPYGIRRATRWIGVGVDDPAAFRAAVERESRSPA
jgi:hypothetical protein